MNGCALTLVQVLYDRPLICFLAMVIVSHCIITVARVIVGRNAPAPVIIDRRQVQPCDQDGGA